MVVVAIAVFYTTVTAVVILGFTGLVTMGSSPGDNMSALKAQARPVDYPKVAAKLTQRGQTGGSYTLDQNIGAPRWLTYPWPEQPTLDVCLYATKTSIKVQHTQAVYQRSETFCPKSLDARQIYYSLQPDGQWKWQQAKAPVLTP